MKRREFIAGLGAVALPLAAHAQQPEPMRRIGVLMPLDENDPEGKLRYSVFTQALAGLGWIDGRDVRMDLRCGGDDTNRVRALAQELVGLRRAKSARGFSPLADGMAGLLRFAEGRSVGIARRPPQSARRFRSDFCFSRVRCWAAEEIGVCWSASRLEQDGA